MKLSRRFAWLICLIMLVSLAVPGFAMAETKVTNLRLSSYGDMTVDGFLLTPEEKGSDISLYAGAENDDASAAITYQWYWLPASDPIRMNVEPGRKLIENATEETYVISNVDGEKTGSYYCVITDGIETIEHGCTVYFDRIMNYEKLPENQVVQIGEEVKLSALVTSEYGEVSYEWYKWDKNGERRIASTTNTLGIESVKQEDYGFWYCRVKDDFGVSTFHFSITPGMTISLAVTDFKVVEGENIVIKGEVEALSLGEEDGGDYHDGGNYRPPVYFGKCVPYQDEDGVWHDDACDDIWLISDVEGDGTEWEYVLDGNAWATATWTEEDDKYIIEYTITISDISEIWDGKYLIGTNDQFDNSDRIYFEISLEDYSTKLLDKDGVAIEGVLHPGASLNLRPLENHIRNYFKQHMGEDVELVWENDVTLEIHGDADEHKGDLKLHIPVNKKYEGMTLTVLHYTGGEVEELTGVVKDGVLTITTKSLSPFAVVAPEEAEEPVVPEEEKPAEPEEPAAPEEEPAAPEEEPEAPEEDTEVVEKDDVPETGDSFPIWMCAALMAAAVVGAVVLAKRRAVK